MRKVIVSWSGGKDSCLACYQVMCQGYEVSTLVNTVSADYRRVRFHGTENTLIQKQVQSTGIPLRQKETTADAYEQEFKELLQSAMADGVEGIVFGDIHLAHCREWAERLCQELGTKAIEPLWGCHPEAILQEFIHAGFEAIVVSTQANLLGEEWIGRRLDETFLNDIKKFNHIDACGENGEFHTLVIDGPLFKKRIDITESHKVLRDGYWFLDIRRYGLMKKICEELEKK